MKTNIFRKILGTFAVLMLALGAGITLRFASAGTGESGSGWLWGGGIEADGVAPWDGTNTGVRWISMNNVSSGDAISYGVNIPSSNGVLSGYAWSGGDAGDGGLGWISFNDGTIGGYPNDLSGCPSGTCSARRDGSDIKGWARILSIRDAGANSGGWSGWVQLDVPTAVSSGNQVRVTGTTLSGYAYSDELGWIDFSGASVTPPNILQVCRDGIPISGAGLNFSLAVNQLTNLKVYFDATADCAGTDVTALLATTWTESGPNAVFLSGSNPKVVTAGAVASPAEQVTINHNDAGNLYSVTMNISVTCSETVNCNDESAAVCRGKFVPAGTIKTGTCGPVDCGNLEGTRYCDMNWKEVAPGN